MNSAAPRRSGLDEIFVFASNRSGRHGAGAALTARKMYGAIYGRGVGRQGSSYAIPTKDFMNGAGYLPILPLEDVKVYVDEFIEYAKIHPELRFRVTAIGTGHAGRSNEEMAPLFKLAPSNCYLCGAWNKILGAGRHSRS